ncbi:MAG: ABC transporter substrate-binding protein [Alphaproteobacteria bacterium]|nr:ABC transporter substrate-binding protein [Alphaproteobacteria bacterium]
MGMVVMGTAASLQAEGMVSSIGKGEGEVSIVAWAGYIERGANDKAYDWVTGFEKETGCIVKEKSAATSDEMVSLMKEGSYDLVTASGDASLRLVAGGLVQPVNLALIPNYNTVDKRLQNAPWHTVDGVHYGVPYQWGWNVLMYNTKTFGNNPPNSWSVVFEEMTLPDGKSNKGRVQAYDGPIYIADAALYLKSKTPSLGITDPFSLNETQYQAAISLLKAQRKLVGRYWHDATVQVDDFMHEGVVVSSAWQFQANILMGKKFSVATVVPKEGATGWADTTMIHARAKHPNCAYKWLQHSLQPKLQGDLASWFGSVPSVPAACKASKLLGAQGCKDQGFNDFDKISFWKTPRANCQIDGKTCVPYSRWVTDYLAILGSK